MAASEPRETHEVKREASGWPNDVAILLPIKVWSSVLNELNVVANRGSDFMLTSPFLTQFSLAMISPFNSSEPSSSCVRSSMEGATLLTSHSPLPPETGTLISWSPHQCPLSLWGGRGVGALYISLDRIRPWPRSKAPFGFSFKRKNMFWE